MLRLLNVIACNGRVMGSVPTMYCNRKTFRVRQFQLDFAYSMIGAILRAKAQRLIVELMA